ncbi:hypothetical protein HanHA89_Chr08g0293511 [Helianthus annuus]|nr:hypothetical protein HanHA89_Chr08g0293511 [Helianthus annuus]
MAVTKQSQSSLQISNNISHRWSIITLYIHTMQRRVCHQLHRLHLVHLRRPDPFIQYLTQVSGHDNRYSIVHQADWCTTINFFTFKYCSSTC